MAKHSIVRDRTCAQCGTSPITGYKFCSLPCNQEYQRRTRGIQPVADLRAARKQAAHKATCFQCEVEFAPGRQAKLGGQKIRGMYCSKACLAEHQRKVVEHPEVTRERIIYRKWAMGHGRGIQASKYRRWGERARSQCKDCGKPVGPRRTRIFPAPRCAVCSVSQRKRLAAEFRKSDNGKALRRAGKAERRAVERSATSERFDPFEVFDRDGWRCHLCGVKTPKALRGSYDDRAPELDHLLPLALGGQHTRLNTACSCRRCNIAKGAKALGQLRLIG